MKFKKVSNYLKELAKAKKISEIKDFVLMIIGYGFLINFSLWALFGFQLNLFTLIAYGFVYSFINEEFVTWIRRIVFRR